MDRIIDKTFTYTKTVTVINPLWLLSMKVSSELTFRDMARLLKCSAAFVSDCTKGQRQNGKPSKSA